MLIARFWKDNDRVTHHLCIDWEPMKVHDHQSKVKRIILYWYCTIFYKQQNVSGMLKTRFHSLCIPSTFHQVKMILIAVAFDLESYSSTLPFVAHQLQDEYIKSYSFVNKNWLKGMQSRSSISYQNSTWRKRIFFQFSLDFLQIWQMWYVFGWTSFQAFSFKVYLSALHNMSKNLWWNYWMQGRHTPTQMEQIADHRSFPT